MITRVRARFSNGVLTPLEPLDLEEGKEVTVSFEGAPLAHASENATDSASLES